MTDKEIVLELTKLAISNKRYTSGEKKNNLLGGDVSEIFNKIAQEIAPTLEKLNKDTKKD